MPEHLDIALEVLVIYSFKPHENGVQSDVGLFQGHARQELVFLVFGDVVL